MLVCHFQLKTLYNLVISQLKSVTYITMKSYGVIFTNFMVLWPFKVLVKIILKYGRRACFLLWLATLAGRWPDATSDGHRWLVTAATPVAPGWLGPAARPSRKWLWRAHQTVCPGHRFHRPSEPWPNSVDCNTIAASDHTLYCPASRTITFGSWAIDAGPAASTVPLCRALRHCGPSHHNNAIVRLTYPT